VWVSARGDTDRGVAYPVTRWRSVTNRAYYASLDALVGVNSAGLGVSREVYAEVGEEGRRRSLSLGLAALVPYEEAGAGEATVALYGVLRVGRKSPGKEE
jgi:hypothetical protein